MIATARRYMTAIAGAALIAVAVSACGGGGDGDDNRPTTTNGGENGNGENGENGDGPVVDGPPEPADVDLSRVTPGFMAGAGTVRVSAGQSRDHGDIAFSCAAGGDDCEVMVMVENGKVTATSIGGTVTAKNSDAYSMRIRVPNEANSIHAATGIDLVRGTDPLVSTQVSARASGSDYHGVEQTGGSVERRAHVIPWVNDDGDVHFVGSLHSSRSGSELDPLVSLGRFFNTSDLSSDPDGIETTFMEDSSHGLRGDWRVFEVTRSYAGGGTWTTNVATDAHVSPIVLPQEPYVGYGDFDRNIELTGIPVLPDDQDWQGVNVADGVRGTLDGDPGEFKCFYDPPECGLEFRRSADAEGYYPHNAVVFTPDDGSEGYILSGRNYSQIVSTTDYLVFGIWQYVPEDVAAVDEYDFGAFAGGGFPFNTNHPAKPSGNAVYNGAALGMYYTDISSQTPSVSSFEARVELLADFGDMVEYGALSGTVYDMQYDDAASGFPAQLTLGQTDISPFSLVLNDFWTSGSDGLLAAGEVSEGQPTSLWSGMWQAMFYGYSRDGELQPTGVAGTFGATNDEDGLVGAFGARRQ